MNKSTIRNYFIPGRDQSSKTRTLQHITVHQGLIHHANMKSLRSFIKCMQRNKCAHCSNVIKLNVHYCVNSPWVGEKRYIN